MVHSTINPGRWILCVCKNLVLNIILYLGYPIIVLSPSLYSPSCALYPWFLCIHSLERTINCPYIYSWCLLSVQYNMYSLIGIANTFPLWQKYKLPYQVQLEASLDLPPWFWVFLVPFSWHDIIQFLSFQFFSSPVTPSTDNTIIVKWRHISRQYSGYFSFLRCIC